MYLLGPGKAAFVFFTDRLAPEVRIKQKKPNTLECIYKYSLINTCIYI